MPLVSVIIPSRNRPLMLREAAESVVAQTHQDLEIIIVLTGADDATTSSAKALEREFGARLVVTPSRNLAASRNNGLAVARGEWVSFLDDDDLWLPTKLEKQIKAAEHESADLVTTSWTRFGDGMIEEVWMPQGRSPLPDGMDYQQALVVDNFVSVGSLVRTNILRELGGFDTGMRACEDWDMWRRVSHAHKIVFIDEFLMRVRIHGHNMSKSRWLMFSATLRHHLKMIFDTPPDLRHLLRPLPSLIISSILNYGYFVANNISGGRMQSILRSLTTSRARQRIRDRFQN